MYAEFVPITGQDVGALVIDGDEQPEILLQTEFLESHPRVSPDGRWLAYSSDESGQREIYVRPFPNVNDGRWQVSNGFGLAPTWGPAGRELFYQTRASPDTPIVTMMRVEIDTEPTFRPGNPVALFEGPYRLGMGTAMHAFDISPDGRTNRPDSANATCGASSQPPIFNASRPSTTSYRISSGWADICCGRRITVCFGRGRLSNGMR